MQEILQYLSKNEGERLDSEIASAIGISLAKVRIAMSDLSARGAIMMCRLTRYKDGERIDGMLCRLSGYVPPLSPGRKSKAQVSS